MKGKQLYYEDLMKLPIGTKVFILCENDKKKVENLITLGIDIIESYKQYKKFRTVYCSKTDENIKFYEWIE